MMTGPSSPASMGGEPAPGGPEAAPNPWLDRGVFRWAHQGGAREAPSNTLHAMDRGLEAGADGIELDVHLSSDGRLVLIHDATLERTTNGRGRVAKHDQVALGTLDAAYWWVPGEVDQHDPATPAESYTLRGKAADDPDLRLPTLEDVLDRYPGVPLTIEVKTNAAVEPLVQVLRERRRTTDLILTSFKDGIVRRLRRAGPELPVAPGRIWNIWFLVRVRLLRGSAPRSASRYVAVQLPLRYKLVPFMAVLDQRVVTVAHQAGLAVHAWTIDDEVQMRHLVELGVDGIMTDLPSLLKAVLSAQGRS